MRRLFLLTRFSYHGVNDVARRTGIPALMEVAKELCRLIAKFSPIIVALYGDDPAVSTALSTANAACAALHEKLMEIAEPGV